MTAPARRTDRRARARRRRARRVAAWALRLAVVLVAFVLGVALGQALRDEPDAAGDRTFVRTLRPGTVAPARETVTVSVDTP